ncbi:MAG: hypothetical protein JKY98_03225 [Gammaproteobacteria bacterium]|nr:hypothetical protein [Gammaproteobacteria bacterium]
MNKRLAFFVIGFAILASTLSAFAAEEDNGVWIDVRSTQDYRKGHIEGAINIPHADIGYRINKFVSDPGITVHLYDDGGVYAGLALQILMEMGFEYVINEGGYESILKKQSP